MARYLLVVNPASGRGRALLRARSLQAALAEPDGVHVVETRGRGNASEVVRERGSDFDRVIAIGGDGTLNEVLGGLWRLRASGGAIPALGFLPSGTANAAVLAFGLDASPDRVARSLPTVDVRHVDVGVVTHGETERPFLLWFGAGYDAVVIDALNRKRTGLMGIAGLARKSPAVLRAVHRYPAPDIEIHSDEAEPSTATSVMLANVSKVAFGGVAARSADPFDGQLDLLTVPRLRTAGVAALALRMLASSLDSARGVGHARAARVRLSSTGEVPFQLDGEPVGTLPVEVRVEGGALQFLMT